MHAHAFLAQPVQSIAAGSLLLEERSVIYVRTAVLLTLNSWLQHIWQPQPRPQMSFWTTLFHCRMQCS
jgi:hypothetical protein